MKLVRLIKMCLNETCVVYITLEPKFYWIVLQILRNSLALTLVREQQSLVDVGTHVSTHSQQFRYSYRQRSTTVRSTTRNA
jgi:hypothetical protein